MKVVNLLTNMSIEMIGDSIAKFIYVLKESRNAMVFIDEKLYDTLNAAQQSELNTFIKDSADYTPAEMCEMDVLVIKTDFEFDILDFISLVNKFSLLNYGAIKRDFFQILD